MALKDLSDFKSQYALHKNMQLLTEALTAVQNPAGQPLIPNGEGTPMGNLIRQLNLQEPVQAPPYDFELDENVTLNEIIHQCNIRNINQFDVIQNLGSRSFYDHTYSMVCLLLLVSPTTTPGESILVQKQPRNRLKWRKSPVMTAVTQRSTGPRPCLNSKRSSSQECTQMTWQKHV